MPYGEKPGVGEIPTSGGGKRKLLGGLEHEWIIFLGL
jgi:hypothetical protein